MKKLLGLFILGVMANCAHAQLVFTVATTANATAGGYTAGQVATFSFTLTGADISANGGHQFFSYTNQWWDDVVADTPIFTAVSGTGVGGSLMLPTANANDPFQYVQALPVVDQLTFSVGAETSNIGKTANGTIVGSFLAGNLEWSGANFPAPGSYTDLTAYFTPYVGTHPLVGGYFDIYLATPTVLHFTATSLTISAIPEPATVSLLLGVTAAGVLGVREVKRRRTA